VHQLCVIPGDGIGLEVIPAAVEVLSAVVPDLEIFPAEAGWDCFLTRGTSVPAETLELINQCGAALFGAVSSPSHKVAGYQSAILTMRQSLNLYANIRPVKSLPFISPRPDVDMIIFRENTEGLYAGLEQIEGDRATATRVITRQASRRIANKMMEIIEPLNRQKITIVHKANILPLTDGLFRDSVREVISEVRSNGFNIQTNELLVDIAALKMVADPQYYDVLITTNLFGDILSDAAAHWCGGMGYAPSINMGDSVAVAEPVHGSAPDIAGKGIANPIAAILSAALLLRYVWRLPEKAIAIENAVNATLMEICVSETHNILSGTKTTEILDTILSYL
jgi:homoisocitrate dehydrogenase